MNYTVKKLATLAGISVRTLHHYDQIGLLRPAFNKENGYRYYGEKELLRLQQILFYRELEFSLDQIKSMIDNPRFDAVEALMDQKKLLLMERRRLRKLIKTIDATVESLKGGEKMSDDQLYGGFTKQQMEEYKEEARQKWGSEMVNQSEERMKNWTPEDFKRIQDRTDALMKSIVSNMDKGVESPDVQADIDAYFNGMQEFYDCSYEIFRGLGKMYVEDARFTAFYDKYHPDLAQFMCDAMAYYCDVRKGKNS